MISDCSLHVFLHKLTKIQHSCTAAGMMAYEDALRLLATAETPKPRDMTDLDYELWLDDLVASKYTYVVASQARSVCVLCNMPSTQIVPRMLALCT